MSIRMKMLCASVLGLALSACQQEALPEADLVITGGHVWQNGAFAEKDLHVADGIILADAVAGETTRTLDATGQYIVPAYGNAHQHITRANMDNTNRFFEAGVYYVANPNLLYSATSEDWWAFFERPDTIDVIAAMGGITERRSHPEPLYTDVLADSVYEGATYEDLFQNAFNYGHDEEEIVATLDLLQEQGANLIKIYLLDSQNYISPAEDGTPQSFTGLNPDNVAFLIDQAHARGLRVTAHIESAHDLRVVAEAGIDYIAHLPGYRGARDDEEFEQRLLTEDDARLLAENNIPVVPTYAVSVGRLQDGLELAPEEYHDQIRDSYARAVRLQEHNLELLEASGVQLLVGTDLSPGEAHTEIQHWADVGVLSTETILEGVFSTGAFLFPDRRIGCLDAGCEADFLVLQSNPRADVTALQAISHRFKAGHELVIPQSNPDD